MAWRPHHIGDINLIEGVQRRAARMMSECKGMEYEKVFTKGETYIMVFT
jgi:hypothetical protein